MLQTLINPYAKKQLRICRQAVETYLYEQFSIQFSTNAASLKELFRDANKLLLKCRHCGAIPTDVNFESRMRICESCGKKTSCTAGTFFDHMREPKAWLAAIWFMERGIVPTSSHFAKLVGISQSSALNILRKMRMVMMAAIDDDFPTVGSSVLYEIVSKRSLETPARSRPLQEEVEIAKKRREQKAENQPLNNEAEMQDCDDEYEGPNKQSSKKEPSSKFRTVLSFLDSFAQSVYELLSEVPTSFDKLCQRLTANSGQLSSALVMLSIAGLVAQLPGDCYVRIDSEDSEVSQSEGIENSDTARDELSQYDFLQSNCLADGGEVPGIIDSQSEADVEPNLQNIAETRPVSLTEFVDFALLYFTGISRKHIQLYVSALWCQRVRHRWGFGGLRELCLRSEAISDEDVLHYVTPPIVKLFEHEN